ncbi:Uncharacterised protein [Yersinia mollaretii]|uniref:Uncharacterized protein n=1 Tax=Yersinia mollaretii TaxID=33060 RepID=A0AA36PKX1_YERMO|nr:Uncharacterised protein [Yersinia mollaretii]
MLNEQVVGVLLNLNNFIINIFTRCQYHRRVDFQRDSGCAADNQDHSNGLGAAAALLHQRLIGFGAVGNGNQITVFIQQANFPNPPPALGLRDNLLRNNLTGVNWVNRQGIKSGAALFVHQLGLCWIGCWQGAATIPNCHLGDL